MAGWILALGAEAWPSRFGVGMPRLFYSLVRGAERMRLNAMCEEDALAEAYHDLGYCPIDADPLTILGKLTHEGFRVECEGDYPYRQSPEADKPEDLHMMSLMSQKQSLR